MTPARSDDVSPSLAMTRSSNHFKLETASESIVELTTDLIRVFHMRPKHQSSAVIDYRYISGSSARHLTSGQPPFSTPHAGLFRLVSCTIRLQPPRCSQELVQRFHIQSIPAPGR